MFVLLEIFFKTGQTDYSSISREECPKVEVNVTRASGARVRNGTAVWIVFRSAPPSSPGRI
jgi:hypothetical protein